VSVVTSRLFYIHPHLLASPLLSFLFQRCALWDRGGTPRAAAAWTEGTLSALEPRRGRALPPGDDAPPLSLPSYDATSALRSPNRPPPFKTPTRGGSFYVAPLAAMMPPPPSSSPFLCPPCYASFCFNGPLLLSTLRTMASGSSSSSLLSLYTQTQECISPPFLTWMSPPLFLSARGCGRRGGPTVVSPSLLHRHHGGSRCRNGFLGAPACAAVRMSASHVRDGDWFGCPAPCFI
jgi:hypothetical protein